MNDCATGNCATQARQDKTLYLSMPGQRGSEADRHYWGERLTISTPTLAQKEQLLTAFSSLASRCRSLLDSLQSLCVAGPCGFFPDARGCRRLLAQCKPCCTRLLLLPKHLCQLSLRMISQARLFCRAMQHTLFVHPTEAKVAQGKILGKQIALHHRHNGVQLDIRGARAYASVLSAESSHRHR